MYVCVGRGVCPFFVVQYLVWFQVLHSSRRGRQSFLLYFIKRLLVPWVGVQCVIVASPGHPHLLFGHVRCFKNKMMFLERFVI